MPSLINKLKENVLDKTMQPPQIQAQQPPQATQSPHPQMMAIEAMQKRKADLLRQQQQMNPAGSMLQNAAATVMNAPATDSPMALLAKGLMGASSGLKQHGLEQQENLRQQQEIDQSIANTYQFIKDYDYNRSITREKLDLERRKVDIHEMDVTGRQLGERAKLAQERMTKGNDATKNLESKYEFLRDAHQQAEKILEMKNQLKPWDALSSKLFGKGAAMFNNNISKINVLTKEANDLLTKYLAAFKTGGKMSVYVAQLIESGKPSVEMGYDAFFKLVDNIYKETGKDIHRTEYTMDKTNQGIPSNIATRAYDLYEQSEGSTTPDELISYYLQNNKFPSVDELRALKMQEEEHKRAMRQGVTGQEDEEALLENPQQMEKRSGVYSNTLQENDKQEDITHQMKSDAQRAAERIFAR